MKRSDEYAMAATTGMAGVARLLSSSDGGSTLLFFIKKLNNHAMRKWQMRACRMLPFDFAGVTFLTFFYFVCSGQDTETGVMDKTVPKGEEWEVDFASQPGFGSRGLCFSRVEQVGFFFPSEYTPVEAGVIMCPRKNVPNNAG